MIWQAWVLIIWFVSNCVISLFMVDRTVTGTRGGAFINIFVVYPFLIWCVIQVVNS